MIIVSTAKISTKHQTRLRDAFTGHEFFFYASKEEAYEHHLTQAEVLLTYGEDLTDVDIDQMQQLKWIQVLSAGLDEMPWEALQRHNILVTNAKGIHKIPMAEYTMGMMLQLARRHYEFYDLQKAQTWDRSLRVDELYGKTIGILGVGAIGEEIAKRAKAFGMKVLGLRRSTSEGPTEVDDMIPIEEKSRLFEESDYVVVTLPHTKDTEHFISSDELDQMKDTAYLINIGRGKVVDESALVTALKHHTIAGAVLDVYHQEPLPHNHPLWTLDNIILTPHVSGRSPLYMRRALDIFEDNMRQYPEVSQMRNVVALDRRY
ncbi:D-2-hydroxyacid dehydrogenase [Caldalkalibacillus salinus]|uniref:D-2-hydroxyacid dehydrogenase n=1 Tax=Caldalkalibacillus salinus TaxID=2803787 RepID=UPI001923452B|nr:D-2-hydroxyacid dehydrogenase [Caldalkalibacillus salinus]